MLLSLESEGETRQCWRTRGDIYFRAARTGNRTDRGLVPEMETKVILLRTKSDSPALSGAGRRRRPFCLINVALVASGMFWKKGSPWHSSLTRPRSSLDQALEQHPFPSPFQPAPLCFPADRRTGSPSLPCKQRKLSRDRPPLATCSRTSATHRFSA